jgi:hypothetical protein
MHSPTEPGFTQVVSGFPTGINPAPTPSTATLLIPACVAAFSAFILLVHTVFSLKSVQRRFGAAGTADEVATPGIGKGAILVYRIVRLVGCAALVALSITSLSGEHKTGIKWSQGEGGMLLTYVGSLQRALY